jgi:hypothetical protein
VGAEARFHDFCLGCHRDPPAYLSGHGPVTGCSTCHAPPSAAAPRGLRGLPGLDGPRASAARLTSVGWLWRKARLALPVASDTDPRGETLAAEAR